jgi:uncharacterized membrane protein
MTPPSRGIPVSDAVHFGWNTFKENAALIIAIEIAAMIAVGLVNGWSAISEDLGWFYQWVMWLADFVLGMVINLGAINIALGYRDGKKVEFDNLFDNFDILPSFMVAAVLAGFAISLGLVFLIIPGIILYIRFLFYGHTLLDERSGPVEALLSSFRVTEGYGVDLFLFVLVLAGINFLGFLCFAVGLFVTIPISYGATAYIYRFLRPREVTESS